VVVLKPDTVKVTSEIVCTFVFSFDIISRTESKSPEPRVVPVFATVMIFNFGLEANQATASVIE